MKKFFLRAIIASSLIGSSLMAAELNADAVSDINGNARAIKGYYINYTGAEWIYINAATSSILWWGNSTIKQAYKAVTGSVTISDDKTYVEFGDLSSEDADAAATIDEADNKQFPIKGYFVQTEVKDANNLPVWFYIDTATSKYMQYPNNLDDFKYVDATTEITSTIDIATGEVVPKPTATPTPTSEFSLTPPNVTEIPSPF